MNIRPDDSHTVYYLIEPRSALEPRIDSRVDAALKRVLLQPRLLGNSEAPGTGWSDDDYEAAVKLTFLASLSQYDQTRSDEDFAHVFGTNKLTPFLFDRWWTLRRIKFDDWLKSYQPVLEGALYRVEKSGNHRVDAWINSMR